MPPRTPNDDVVLHAALTLLLAGNGFDRQRAMVAVQFRKLGSRHQQYVQYAHVNKPRGLDYAVTRTAKGHLAIHPFPEDPMGTYVGLARLSGQNAWNARLVPPNNAVPLRTFASARAAINFMSAYGRAWPHKVQLVGMSAALKGSSSRPSSSNAKRVAATTIQSAFRGWKSRRNTYAPPSPANPRGGIAYQAAMRRFNAAR